MMEDIDAPWEITRITRKFFGRRWFISVQRPFTCTPCLKPAAWRVKSFVVWARSSDVACDRALALAEEDR